MLQTGPLGGTWRSLKQGITLHTSSRKIVTDCTKLAHVYRVFMAISMTLAVCFTPDYAI